MRSCILLLLFLTTSIFAQAQNQTDLDRTLDSLLNNHRIDSIYLEELVYPEVKNQQRGVTNSAWFHGDSTALAPYKVKLHSKTYFKRGFKLVTFYNKEKQSVWYFHKNKRLESRVYFQLNQMIRVDLYDRDGALDEYYERVSGIWYLNAAESNWEPQESDLDSETIMHLFGSIEELENLD